MSSRGREFSRTRGYISLESPKLETTGSLALTSQLLPKKSKKTPEIQGPEVTTALIMSITIKFFMNMYGTALSLTEVNITMPRLMKNVSAEMDAIASICAMTSSRLSAGLYGARVVGNTCLPVLFVMLE